MPHEKGIIGQEKSQEALVNANAVCQPSESRCISYHELSDNTKSLCLNNRPQKDLVSIAESETLESTILDSIMQYICTREHGIELNQRDQAELNVPGKEVYEVMDHHVHEEAYKNKALVPRKISMKSSNVPSQSNMVQVSFYPK